MNDAGWHLPGIDQYDGIFHTPSEFRLKKPVSTVCIHCRRKQIVHTVELINWPDRKEKRYGYIWICAHCGSRYSIKPEPLPRPTPTQKPVSSRHSPLLAVLVFFLVILIAVVVSLGIWLKNQSSSNNNETDQNVANTKEREKAEKNSIFDFGDEDDEEDVQGLSEEAPTIENPLVYCETMYDVGNSFINISEGGLMLTAENWIFYTNPADNYYIYRMDLNMENSELICAIPAYYLNYHDGMLYFSGSNEGRQQYRMYLDGTGLEMINSRKVYEGKIVGDYIYYDDIDDDYALYRSRLDGSDETFISSGIVFYLIITNDKIYYIDTNDDRHCYRMDLDGRNKEMFIDLPCRDMCLLDDVLYLTLKDGGVYAYDTVDGDFWKISDVKAGCIIAHTDGWIYFCNMDKNDRLYKMTLNGESMTKLTEDSVEFVNVYSNLISYQNKDTKEFFWCLTDSSHKMAIR